MPTATLDLEVEVWAVPENKEASSENERQYT
jgi:hypothetical protein